MSERPVATEHDSEPAAPDVLAGRLRSFARAYPDLPLYHRVTSAAADDPDVVDLLTSAGAGQARPVLLLAALHDLVLRDPSVRAARWYSSVAGDRVPPGDPWPDVRATLLDHAEEIRAVVATRSTQTNEVNRAVTLGAMVARAASDLPSAPVALLELGASAGLLLGLARYRIDVGGLILGTSSSSVRCAGRLRAGSSAVEAALPPISAAVGLDRAPVRLDDVDELRWLEACLWPDQPERLQRFRAAVALLTVDPPRVVAGDMVDDLATTAASLPSDTHLVVVSSWALTYVRRDRRPLVADVLADLAATGRAVSWLTAEPPGCAPGIAPPEDAPPGGETILGARRWRDGVELPPACWGTAHPHGTWLHLTP